MTIYGPIVLAGLLGAFFTALETVTGKYSNTSHLLWGSKSFYIYLIVYGAIAGLAMWLLPALIEAGAFGVASPAADAGGGTANSPLDLSNTWVQAVVLGISIKALLHIRLANVSAGGQSFPIGVETVVQMFEPRLLRMIEMDHYQALQDFLAPFVARYDDLAKIKQQALANIPRFLGAAESAALKGDIASASNVFEALETYLSYVGRKQLKHIFPV